MGWQERGLCRGRGGEFFSGDEASKRICADCPVAWLCLNEAVHLDLMEPDDGIWGGMSGPERDTFVRRYPTLGCAARQEHRSVLHRLRRRELQAG